MIILDKWAILMLAALGIFRVIFAILLKREDRISGYGLELPSSIKQKNNIKMKRNLLLLLIAFVIASCTTEIEVKPPKNIILMIGDGMGTSQVYSAYIANKGFLNLERCKYVGFVKTYSADNLITDSGAGGTAIATGFKTNSRMIGMAPDSTELTSILKYAEANNKSTGLVASSKINHATPASFIANNVYRYNYEEIAYDFLKTDIDVFIGGGLDDFTQRADGLNLLDSLKDRNYEIIRSLDELESANGDKIAGLLYPDHPPKISEGRGDMLRISSLKAIEILNKNEEGFFLMIEGSQIDWGGHDKLTSYVVDEMLDFDKTVGAVLDFAEMDGNTLVIITSDHETGGFAITGGDISKGLVEGAFTTSNHTAVMVPMFAFGPGADEFTGIIENTDIFKKMFKAFNFKLDVGKKK